MVFELQFKCRSSSNRFTMLQSVLIVGHIPSLIKSALHSSGHSLIYQYFFPLAAIFVLCLQLCVPNFSKATLPNFDLRYVE